MTTVFIILVLNQVVATGTFAAVYGFGSNWRSTPIGRHLMFYTLAAGGIDLSWLALVVLKSPWLMYVLFAAQLALGALTWQRVWLVRKAQREEV